jgi:hypothetical protein
MSVRKPIINWFENLNRAYQVAFIVLFFLGLSGSLLTAGWTFWVAVMDFRIARRVDPLVDMLEFSMKQSGHWDPYIEEKEKRDRDRKIRDPLQVSVDKRPWLKFIDN